VWEGSRVWRFFSFLGVSLSSFSSILSLLSLPYIPGTSLSLPLISPSRHRPIHYSALANSKHFPDLSFFPFTTTQPLLRGWPCLRQVPLLPFAFHSLKLDTSNHI
jgi:hypothetical protein